MAYISQMNRTVGQTAGAPISVAGLVTRFTTWNEARRTRNALARLTDHELDDIGLTRGDIDAIGRR